MVPPTVNGKTPLIGRVPVSGMDAVNPDTVIEYAPENIVIEPGRVTVYVADGVPLITNHAAE